MPSFKVLQFTFTYFNSMTKSFLPIIDNCEVKNWTESEYRSYPAVNFSNAKHFLKSPRTYRWMVDHPEERSTDLVSGPADKFVFGSALHSLILEGHETFQDLYPVAPKLDRRKKADKEAWKEFCSSLAPGARPISPSDYERILLMADSLNANTHIRQMLKACEYREVALHGSAYGIEVKGKLDAFCPARGLLTDLKTTVSVDPDKFRHSVTSFGYALQSAFYSSLANAAFPEEGRDASKWEVSWIVIEKEAPYDCCLYWPDPRSYRTALRKVRDMLEGIANCTHRGIWPGVKGGQLELSDV